MKELSIKELAKKFFSIRKQIIRKINIKLNKKNTNAKKYAIRMIAFVTMMALFFQCIVGGCADPVFAVISDDIGETALFYAVDECEDVYNLDEDHADCQGILYELDEENQIAFVKGVDATFVEYCSTHDGTIVIPKGVQLDEVVYRVIGLHCYVFLGQKGIKTITFASSIQRIENASLAGCSVEGVYICAQNPDFTGSAFENCTQLREIKFSNENSAYIVQDGLLMSADQKTLIYYLPGCHNEEHSYVLPDSIERIGRGAFGYAKLSYIDLNNATRIDDLAFDSSNLVGIDCSNVEYMEHWVFNGCTNLKWVRMSQKAYTLYANFWGCTSLDCLYITGGMTYNPNYEGFSKNFLCENMRNLKCIIFEEGVTSIPEGACSNCSNLEIVILPESLRVIKSDAFTNCEKLQKVYIPESVTTISAGAFSGSDVVIFGMQDSVAMEYAKEQGIEFVNVEEHTHKAFRKKIIYHDDVQIVHGTYCEECGYAKDTSIDIVDLAAPGCGVNYRVRDTKIVRELDETFADAQGVIYTLDDNGMVASVTGMLDVSEEQIVIPEKVSYHDASYTVECIGKMAFQSNETVRIVTIPDTVTVVFEDAFLDSKVEFIYLGRNVNNHAWTFAANGPFYHCTNLKSITVSKQNQELMDLDGVLYSKDMSEILYYPAESPHNSEMVYELPETVTTIQAAAFNYSQVPYVKGSGVTTIKRQAFEHAEIYGMDLSKVTYVGYDGFSFCNNLRWVKLGAQTMLYGQSFEEPDTYAFCFDEKLDSLYVTASCYAATQSRVSDSNFCGGYALRFLAFEDGITSLNLAEFCEVEELASFCIPDTVTTVYEPSAIFSSKNHKLYIPKSVTKVEEEGFCNNPTTIEIYGEAGSYAQDYAEEKGYQFFDVSNHKHEQLENRVIYENDWLEYYGVKCETCGYVKVREVVLKDTAYTVPSEQESTEVTETTSDTGEGQTTENSEDTENSQTTEDLSSSENTEDSQTTEGISSSEDTEGNVTTEEQKTTQVAGNNQPSQGTKTTENVSGVIATEHSQSTQENGIADENNEFDVSSEIPKKLTATTKDGRQVRLQWKVSQGNVRYELQRSKKKKSGYRTIAKLSATSYVDKKTTKGKTYYYRVRAYVSSAGQTQYSAFSNVISHTVTGLKTPKITVKKKKTASSINYMEIRMKNMNGTYVELYAKQDNAKYKKVALKVNARKKIKGVLRIGYRPKKSIMYIKVRTWWKVKGKKLFSEYSNVAKVKMK